MVSIASAFNLSFNMVLRRKVLILFNVEKLRSLSDVVIGVGSSHFNTDYGRNHMSQILIKLSENVVFGI